MGKIIYHEHFLILDNGHSDRLWACMEETNLWVVEEGVLVVDAPSSAGGRTPLTVQLCIVPLPTQAEERRVHHATDAHVTEILTVVLKRHPGGGQICRVNNIINVIIQHICNI